jgi:hypothetical protein
MVVFCSVYFRLHYYFRFRGIVKRKTRICEIGRTSRRLVASGRPYIQRGRAYGLGSVCFSGKPPHPGLARTALTASNNYNIKTVDS